MGKRILSIALLVMMISMLIPPTAEASSSISPWAVQDVNRAISHGLVPQSLRLDYDRPTTRAEFCALAVALYESLTADEIIPTKSFNDTNDINVRKMATIAVVTGVGDNLFSPDTQLTREQAATMLSRLASALGNPLAGHSSTFNDNSGISPWAIDAVGQMQASGIMGGVGDNTFAPKKEYLREQSIVTLLRIFDLINEARTNSAYNNSDGNNADDDNNAYVSKLLELINAERNKEGLPLYTETTDLHNAAMKRAVELESYFSHDRPDGRKFSAVLDDFGISYISAGESIANGQETPERVLNSWMNSTLHKANILDSRYVEIGIGMYVDSSGEFFWVLIFID